MGQDTLVQPPPHPQPIAGQIAAPSRRQAMDWSLVLASQGIEHSIDWDETNGWRLHVSESDRERALTHIRLFQEENRHWRWRRPVFQPGVFFDWSSLAWVFLCIFFYWCSETRAGLLTQGIMDNAALAHGEWWRLFTATWLHANLAHLGMNVVFGFLFLGLVMGRYGPGVGILAAYLAGVGGNLITWLVYDQSHRGLGASGVVMGALGLLAIQSGAFLKQRNSNTFRLSAAGILAGVLLFVFLGTSPDADVIAHLGGFITGALFGLLLAFAPRLVHRPSVNYAAGILFAALVVLPWWWGIVHANTQPQSLLKIQNGWHGQPAGADRRPAGRNGTATRTSAGNFFTDKSSHLPFGGPPNGTGGSPVPPIFRRALTHPVTT